MSEKSELDQDRGLTGLNGIFDTVYADKRPYKGLLVVRSVHDGSWMLSQVLSDWGFFKVREIGARAEPAQKITFASVASAFRKQLLLIETNSFIY